MEAGGTVGGPRTQAQRDAVTVKIVYALLAGGLVAGVAFCAVAWPVLVWQLGHGAQSGLVVLACVVAVMGFVLRTGTLLVRLRRVLSAGPPEAGPGPGLRPDPGGLSRYFPGRRPGP